MIFLSGREKKVVTIRTNEQTDRQAPTSLLDVQIVVISTAEWSTSLHSIQRFPSLTHTQSNL